MAYDDTSAWHDRQYDEKLRLADQRAATDKLYDALVRGDLRTAGEVVGVPPADTSPEPERQPRPLPTAGEQFRDHSRELLHHVRWHWALRETLRQDWLARIEPLDIEEAETGLCVMEGIGDEFQRVNANPPPNSDITRRIEWDYRMPLIADEIWWVTELFRHVLKFKREQNPFWDYGQPGW